jgi:hypothetical protein
VVPGDSASALPDRRRFAGVVMRRQALSNPWQGHAWVPARLQEAQGLAARRLILREGGLEEWLYPEMPVELFTDEAEGYYLNLTAPAPAAFVHWSEEDDVPRVHRLTVSYHEAARLMDGGMQVDIVAMPAEWLGWVDAFTRAHYHPEAERKRSRPPSFEGARRNQRA